MYLIVTRIKRIRRVVTSRYKHFDALGAPDPPLYAATGAWRRGCSMSAELDVLSLIRVVLRLSAGRHARRAGRLVPGWRRRARAGLASERNNRASAAEF